MTAETFPAESMKGIGMGSRKRVPGLAWLILPLLAAAGRTGACTGLAVYREHTAWFGMNFDYPESAEIAFSVGEWGSRTVFSMSFLEDGDWIPTVAMNDRGLFASMQYQCPMLEGTESPGEGEVYVWQVFGIAMSMLSTSGQVLGVLEEAVIIHPPFPTLHLLVADLRGSAFIAEAGSGRNDITAIEGGHIVMTNFRNADFAGAPPSQVEGVGADRFLTADSLLSCMGGTPGYTDVLRVLRAVESSDPVYVTRVSMSFDPAGGQVYAAPAATPGTVWRISLETATAEAITGPASGEIIDVSERVTGSAMLSVVSSAGD